MSFDYNYKFWVSTKKDIELLLKRQDILKRLKPIKNPLLSYKLFSEMYVLYAELANKLGYVYQNTLQVQKREIVRPLVEAATRRLLELKEELKNMELSEYIYTDKTLKAKKLTPYDLVVWRSPQFLFRRPPELQNILYKNKIALEKVDSSVQLQQQQQQQQQPQQSVDVDVKAAILLIQAHERARQARLYKSAISYDKKNLKVVNTKKIEYKFDKTKENQPMSIPVKRTIFNDKFIKDDDFCANVAQFQITDQSPETEFELQEIENKRNIAASKIQAFWRKYRERKVLRREQRLKKNLYGMQFQRRLKKPNAQANAVIETYKNELMKQQLDEDFVKLINDERTRLLQERTPWVMEDISDHIRAWFQEFYDKVNDFHPYPDPVKQGTVLLLIEETMTPDEYQEKLKQEGLSKEEKKKLKEKEKEKKKKEKEKLKKQKMKELKMRKKLKAAGILDMNYELSSNQNIQTIQETMRKYKTDWQLVDEYLNKTHAAIKEWVTEDQMAIIHRELRALVDEYMRLEYEVLREALCKDQKKKYKPGKVKTPKEKKPKKKKMPKDPTEDRTLDSLYNELRDVGVIVQQPQVKFDDYVAEFNFLADDTRDEDNLTTMAPVSGDIKMVVQECILGMGEFLVNKPKSLCLIGPFKSGKKFLTSIIGSELDAVVMDLSPENIQFFNEDLNYWLHVVMKVAKFFQPTILFMNNVHKVFAKKIPDALPDVNYKILQSGIKKILKNIKTNDRIMLVGTSDMPWSAKGPLKKTFQKILYIPAGDYGTSFLLWLNLLEESAGDFNVEDYAISALAKTLTNFGSGEIADNVRNTLNIVRKMRLKSDPLEPNEFIDYFLEREEPIFPLDVKILDKHNKVFTSTNKLSRARAAFFAKKNAKAKK